MTNGKLNGHAREQLAAEVQAEALRPTPPVNVVARTLHERLDDLSRRNRDLESLVTKLRRLMRANDDQYEREKARQRRELMEDEAKRVRLQNL